MPQYYNGILCISVDEWLQSGLTYNQYENDKKRGYLTIIRTGGGGHPALIEYNTLRGDRRAVIEGHFGDVSRLAQRATLEDYIKPDADAARYYTAYRLPDGRPLREEARVKYLSEACILNALIRYLNDARARRRAMGMRKGELYTHAAGLIDELDRSRYPHDLPLNPRRLKELVQKYRENGYEALVHGNWCNRNSRKVNEKVERLLISIYCMENLPFGEWVHDYYLQFLSGTLRIADAETGELFDRDDFRDRNGNYLIISQATVWNVLNKPDNALVVDRLRKARIDHITQATPFNRRRKPEYSLSMVTLDDWQHNIRTTEGDKLNAYTAFDVASEAIVGWAFDSRTPDRTMVLDCLRSMYANLTSNGLPWPLEAQVENHLIRDMEEQFRGLFPHLTFCTPGVSRDKHAENFIRMLKHGTMKRHQPIGRWYAKHDAYKVKNIAKDEDLKQPRMARDELIATTLEYIHEYNHSLHSNQKRYPGKTRWQVLMENVNPKAFMQREQVLRYIGHVTETSIRNNDYIRLQYNDYYIESFDALKLLKPGNYSVQAYWLPEANGMITEAYLYQDATYLGRALPYERYNTAKAERTPDDERIRTNQAKRQSHFFKKEKEQLAAKYVKVALIKDEQQVDPDNIRVELIEVEPAEPEWDKIDDNSDDVATRAINSL